MKSLQIVSLLGFWSLSLMACSEKKDTVVTPQTTPTTGVTVPVTTDKITFFTDPIMKKANILSISFATNQTVYALGDDANRGYLFKSTDEGKTWAEVNYAGNKMNTVDFYDEKTGILAGATILGTQDGGNNWNPMRKLTSTVIKTSYPKNQQGFMLQLIYDSFHFRKYTEIYSVSTSNLTTDNNYVTLDGYATDIHFLKNKIGILVGEAGNVYVLTVKTDGTYDYSDRLRPVNEDLSSVFLVSEKIAFIGGKNGTFLKSTTAGESWTTIKTAPTGNIKKIAFQQENLGYAIVESASQTNLYKIESSGEKWTKLTTSATAVFNDLKINAQGKAIAVGKDGAVFLF
jgi:photosystem II stability/assembly factor-like uncharacterized protein